MSEDNALTRLMKQDRPVVPNRDTNLVSPGVNTSLSQDQMTPPTDDEVETVRWTVRLDPEICDRIESYCKTINRDPLIEAMFEVAEGDPDVWLKVLELARQKHHRRQEAGKRKRARSMIAKYG